MLTPRALFIRTGGFDEARFAVAYNDPDYCHRLVDAGYRCVDCAEAELTHHEGLSRGFSSDPDELAAYREMHRDRVDHYFSPHFDPEIETFQLKPTVVPIGSPLRPIPMLAVTHNLNWEGAPRIEFELVRRLQAAGVVRAEVFSLDEGPLRRAFELEGIPIRVGPELARIDSGMERYREGVAVLAEWIRERRFEVVHANTLRTFWAVAAAAPPECHRSGACTRASPGRRTSITCRPTSPRRRSPAWLIPIASSSPRRAPSACGATSTRRGILN